MKTNRILLLSLSAVVLLSSCKREGCTDQTALNYDSKAKKENFTCIYTDGTDPNNPNYSAINLTGTENTDRTIIDQTSNSNVADYYIDGTWTINSAITVQPGVRIMMKAGSRIQVNANGSLNLTGTLSNKIEIYGEQNSAGYWGAIRYESNNPNNRIIHCNISNGSERHSNEGMIAIVSNAQATIQNSTFKNMSSNGIFVGENAKIPNFKFNHIEGSANYPLSIRLIHANDIDNSTTFVNNNRQMILVAGHTYSSELIVPKMDIPYNIRGNIQINDGNTTLEAGVEILMGADRRIDVETLGSLKIQGVSGNPVVIKGEQPAKGYWKAIRIKSNNINNVFSYTNISDGDQRYSNEAMVYLSGNSRLEANNCTITNGNSAALDKATNATFIDNGGNNWNDCDGGGGLLP